MTGYWYFVRYHAGSAGELGAYLAVPTVAARPPKPNVVRHRRHILCGVLVLSRGTHDIRKLEHV